jgi:hypothetical protein
MKLEGVPTTGVKTIRDRKGRFLKGESGNPNGRIKGQFPESTRKFMAAKEIAAQHAHDAFKMLWAAMENGESWAFQIFYKDLFHLPKNYGQKTVILEKEERTVDGQIKVITEALPEFDEVTQEESLERLKILNSLKNTDKVELENETLIESTEVLKERVALLKTLMESKDKKG